jgi:hypothetical protein
LSIELSMGGDAFGLGLVDGVDERGRVNPGFDGGLVTAQLGFGVGESAAGVFTLGLSEGAALRVEESLDCPGAVKIRPSPGRQTSGKGEKRRELLRCISAA